MKSISVFVKFLGIQLVIGIIIVLGLTSCESKEEKYYLEAREKFSKYIIPDIKENWKLYISNALVLKKEEEETEAKLAQRGWKEIDPNYSSKEKEGESIKWSFWEEVIKAPEKYVVKTTQDNDILLEYKISSYEGEWLYHSAMLSTMFVKDKRFAYFRIFYIYTPERFGWREVDYEFTWPSVLKIK